MDQKMVDTLSQAFAQAMTQAMPGMAVGTKAPATAPTGAWIHGPGGLFAGTAIEKQVLSLRVAPRGISQVLRAFPSQYTNPEFGYLTGIIQESGQTHPSDECSTCVHAITQSCVQTAQFGRICAETKTLTIARAVERVNRMDVDYQLVNDLFGSEFANDFFRGVRQIDRGRVMQLAVAWAMVEVGVLMQNLNMPLVWTGNPANNVGTGYVPFVGLDTLISTNKVDAHTGNDCEALYSDVKEFNYNLVNSTDAAGNFRIVRLLEYLDAYLYHNASRQGFLPVDWVIVMRPELWYELSMIWPVAWMTTRNITMPAGNTNFLDATRIREMVEQMQSGMFIMLNGRRHRVVLDDGIFEYTNVNDANVPAGSFASNIYMIPLRIMGQRDVTFFEHLDYRVGRREIADARLQNVYWTDDGRFLWTNETEKFCFTISGEIRPRVVLLTPQLAGRIDHVRYAPEQHFRSWDQDSDYFFKGGEDDRPMPSLYSDWNLPD
jgi:hypothetical protein